MVSVDLVSGVEARGGGCYSSSFPVHHVHFIAFVFVVERFGDIQFQHTVHSGGDGLLPLSQKSVFNGNVVVAPRRTRFCCKNAISHKKINFEPTHASSLASQLVLRPLWRVYAHSHQTHKPTSLHAHRIAHQLSQKHSMHMPM